MHTLRYNGIEYEVCIHVIDWVQAPSRYIQGYNDPKTGMWNPSRTEYDPSQASSRWVVLCRVVHRDLALRLVNYMNGGPAHIAEHEWAELKMQIT